MRVVTAFHTEAVRADKALVAVPVSAAFEAGMLALAGIATEEPVAAALLVVAGRYLVIAARVAPAVAAGADIHAFVTAALFALAAGAVARAFVAIRARSLAVIRGAALIVVA